MLHLYFDDDARSFFLTRKGAEGIERSKESLVIDLIGVSYTLTTEVTESSYKTTLCLRMSDCSLILAGTKAQNEFKFGTSIDDLGEGADKLSFLFLALGLNAEKYLNEIDFWSSNEKPDPDSGGVLFTMAGDEIQAKVVCKKSRPELKCYSNISDGNLGEEVMCRPYKDEIIENPLLSSLLTDDDEDEDNPYLDEDEENDESDALATLPRFICDTDTVNQLASSKPNIKDCDPNLTFVVEYSDMPLTLLYAPATDEVKQIARQINGVVIDDDANAYILFFRRGTFPTSSFSVGMQAYAGVNATTGEIKGGATTEQINRCFAALVGAMLRLNIWLQSGDSYDQYKTLDRESAAMLVTATESEITSRVVKGKERPNLQCANLFNLESLFSKEPEVVSARPYLDEISAGWNRELMPLEDKIEQAEAGDTDCMDELAMLYLNGDDEVDAEPEKALYWFRKLAEAGQPNGMFNLGLFYAKGFCVPRDFKQAAEWMRKAEQAGDEDATVLVELYTSMMENEKKAKQGDAEAQAALANGLMKLGGSLEQAGSGNDYKECVSWAQKSAAQGNTAAMWVLALAYHHGRGVKQDMDQAIAYYKKGADLGNADCMHNLGCEYLSGEHLWKNEKKGFELIKRAAEMGNGLAMYNLGRAYQFGNGCVGNMKTALEWYEKAAEVLHDPQIEQRVIAFRSLREIQPDFDEDYSGEEEDPWDDVPLERTQYEGRADRCERLRPGTILEYRFAKDQNNQPVLEMFYQGGSVGVISHFTSEKIIEFLKKDRITLKVIVKSCIPKSQRGARARSADVRLTLEIDDTLPSVPLTAQEKAEQDRIKQQKAEADRKREEERARKEAERMAAEQQRQKEAEAAARKQQEERKAKVDAVFAKRDAEIKRCDEDIKKWTEQKTSAEQKLAVLGFFKFGEKRRQREIIADALTKIEKTKSDKAQLITKYDRELSLMRMAEKCGITINNETDLLKVTICAVALKDGRKHTVSEIIEACPELNEMSNMRLVGILRQMTLDGIVTRTEEMRKAYFQLAELPVSKAAPSAVSTSSAPATPTQLENERYKKAILNLLHDGRRYTINDIMAALPALKDLSNQRVSAIVRQLTLSGEVERIEINRMAYFEIAD